MAYRAPVRALNAFTNAYQRCVHVTLLYFWSWLIQLNRNYKYNGKIACTGISTLNGHISKPVDLREKLKKINCNYFSIFGLQFSTVHFLPFLAHMRPFSVIFWVLEVSHCVTALPKYALGTCEQWEDQNVQVHKNEHVHVTFVNPIFRNFA